ncbi:hypothetical protein ACEW7V_02020 [Areca yellow leaf disease phytoplasma]|uniref:hypothetical protein n=1 Tax=Areca yellow leaf disease phytoplasma TaxID=927614 RepID=UPI0035B5418B
MWHNFSDPRISLALALAGCFKDSILILEKLGIHALLLSYKTLWYQFAKTLSNLDQNDLSNLI